MLALGARMEGLPRMGPAEDPWYRTDIARDVFLGHEFAAEVLEAGPDTVAPPPGTIVTSVPAMVAADGVRDLAYGNDLPGGYSERMLLSAPLLQVVPNGLDPRLAALTEPVAVGLHAVNRSGIGPGDGAVVIGCGPVGLAVIAALRLRGVDAVVASDPSPTRRSLATTMGASTVVDPVTDDVWAAWAADGGTRPLVAFEAVGRPGILDEVLRLVPAQSRVVVVGVCMEPDRITPFFGIAKELQLQFVLAYDLVEFADSLRAIAEGDIDVAPLVTGEVGLDGVPRAFDDLADPERHCKVLVVP
jgi:threonine dehydrogenase-like Zn-dependent dehydrogenase